MSIFKVYNDRDYGFFQRISNQVENMNLNAAFDTLEGELAHGDSERKEFERLKETYNLMIRYLSTGGPDPSRKEMTDAIRRDILAMADRIEFRQKAADSPGSFYSTVRVLSRQGLPISTFIEEFDKAFLLYSIATQTDTQDVNISRKYEEALQELFRAVMATPPNSFSPSDLKMIVDHATDPNSPFALSSQLVSALLIGLLEHYDRNRLIALQEIYANSEEVRVQAQALVAIMLGVRYHSDRLKYDKELSNGLRTLADDLTIYPRLRDIYYSLLQTQDTKRVLNYFQTNIIPQLQKMKPEELKKMMENSLSPDALENPEWADKLQNSDLGEKLRKLNEMQFEGADLMVMAFSNLKMFSFFGSPGNWLLPFDADHTVVRSNIDVKMKPLVDFLEMADMMCDSDKYSFILAINSVPTERREMMINGLASNFDAIKEQMDDLNSKDTRFKREVTRYLRNLYRLFTLSSQLFGASRDDQNGPVAMLDRRYDILTLPILGEVLAQKDVIEVSAEFNFKRKNYEAALPLIEELERFEDSDMGRVWEQIGYIHESEGRFDLALQNYQKAELIKADNIWLLNHIADLYDKSGKYHEALRVMKRLVELGDKSIHPSLAIALTRLGKHDEALKLFQQLSYETSEGSITSFDNGLQPDPESNLSPHELTSFWVALSEIENRRFEKAGNHLPPNLPNPFLPFAILLSLIRREYAITSDQLGQLNSKEKLTKAAKLLRKYNLVDSSLTHPVRIFLDYIKNRVPEESVYQDFLLLLDSI